MTPFSEAARLLVKSMDVGEENFRILFFNPITHRRLDFRHHGLGMLQAEFSESLRIHIWHPSLVSPGMAWPRCVHDHRFDLTSAVVIGQVIDVACKVDFFDRSYLGSWEEALMYEIEHAKNQDRMVDQKGCSTATSAKLLDRVHLKRTALFYWNEGMEYSVPSRKFHTTRVEGLAVTVVHRSNFDDRLARVLCAPDSDVTAISGIVRDDSDEHHQLVDRVMRQAKDAILGMQ